MATERLRTDASWIGVPSEEVPREFRRIFFRHNREVASVSIVAFCLALTGWVVLYGLAYGAATMQRTIGNDFSSPSKRLPFYFVAGVIVSIALTFLLERFYPHERRSAKKLLRPFNLIEAILFVPQLTLTAVQNFSAFIFLRGAQMRLAWEIAQVVARDGATSLQTLASKVPDARGIDGVLHSMQLVGLIKLQRSGDEWALSIPNANARKICQPRVRLRV